MARLETRQPPLGPPPVAGLLLGLLAVCPWSVSVGLLLNKNSSKVLDTKTLSIYSKSSGFRHSMIDWSDRNRQPHTLMVLTLACGLFLRFTFTMSRKYPTIITIVVSVCGLSRFTVTWSNRSSRRHHSLHILKPDLCFISWAYACSIFILQEQSGRCWCHGMRVKCVSYGCFAISIKLWDKGSGKISYAIVTAYDMIFAQIPSFIAVSSAHVGLVMVVC